MHVLLTIAGLAILFYVFLDAFETILLPRRVARTYRITTWFYRVTWRPWAWVCQRIPSPARRESFLGYFGPLSLICLLALWAFGLICGFALLQYGVGEHVQLGGEKIGFATLLYLSGSTFFTLGFGDVTPVSGVARALSVVEAGMGFAFLGVVVGYLPVIYASFSRREAEISLLDARAGSPPSAFELLTRFGNCPDHTVLDKIFSDWEHWAAEVLESHISYPVLCFFRSQHSNQSWLGALTTILDATTLVLVGLDATEEPDSSSAVGPTKLAIDYARRMALKREHAKLTFAMARHAVVDLAQVMGIQYVPDFPDRLPPEELARLRNGLAEHGLRLPDHAEAEHKLKKLRSLYESYAQGLARGLHLELPAFIRVMGRKDNWQSGPWDAQIQSHTQDRNLGVADDHF